MVYNLKLNSSVNGSLCKIPTIKTELLCNTIAERRIPLIGVLREARRAIGMHFWNQENWSRFRCWLRACEYTIWALSAGERVWLSIFRWDGQLDEYDDWPWRPEGRSGDSWFGTAIPIRWKFRRSFLPAVLDHWMLMIDQRHARVVSRP